MCCIFCVRGKDGKLCGTITTDAPETAPTVALAQAVLVIVPLLLLEQKRKHAGGWLSGASMSRVSHPTRQILPSMCDQVKQLDFSRDGKWMLVNGGEKVIRMLEREGTTGRCGDAEKT